MKRILTIDGGGIKGVFPASFLANIEQQIDGPIWEHFDLIAGTSTGGIIALALGLGFSAREILAMYEDNAERIFPPRATKPFLSLKRWNPMPGLLKRKYDTSPLKSILRKRFQDQLLGHSKTRLMICATDLQTGRVNVFKTAHHSRLSTDYKRSAVDIALATSAAPIFFNPHTLPTGQALVDGAMWGNNPMGYAAIEAVHVLGWAPEEIKMLSLSCTEEPPSFSDLAKQEPGLADWGMGIIECFMGSQSSASMGMALHVLEDFDVQRIRRVTEVVKPKMFSLDGTDMLEEMRGLGYSKAREEYPHIKDFFSAKALPFVPVHKL